MLGQLNLEGKDKIQVAIERLKEFEPPEGYYVAFSGGKDSLVVYHLCLEAGVKFDAHYNLTTADPPELVRFIKQYYPDVIIERPKKTMWQLIEEKGTPPTRIMRYCCEHLKEKGGEGRVCITGIRWAESARRRTSRGLLEQFGPKGGKILLFNDNDEARRLLENCLSRKKLILNPIIDWTEDEVWAYIRGRKLPYCSLYNEGFKRLGCIGCPMGGPRQREREFARWPKYRAIYLRTFARMLKRRSERGLATLWDSPEAVMRWWIFGTNQKQTQKLLT